MTVQKNAKKRKRRSAKSKPKKLASEAARRFANLIAEASFRQGLSPDPRPLTNITFWAGAGFSKAWDTRNPTGSELFRLDSRSLERIASGAAIRRLFGVEDFAGIDPDNLRQIVYQLDMYERYPDVRSRYIDEQNIRLFRSRLRAEVVRRFEEVSGLNYFDPGSAKFPLHTPTSAQRSLIEFFRHLYDQADGSEEFVEGVRSHFITTNYDYVIETILDNVVNVDDSLFLYTYRGFTPVQYVNEPNRSPIFDHWLSQHLIKINGGFEIVRHGDNYALDYSRRSLQQISDNPPVLMLPSREQDYSDPYFRTVFPKAVRLLRDSAVLVLVGYSLPQDDALMRIILRQFAEEPEDGREKIVFYVDPCPKQTKLERLRQVYPSIDTAGAPIVCTHEGGFDSFAEECVQIWSEAASRAVVGNNETLGLRKGVRNLASV